MVHEHDLTGLFTAFFSYLGCDNPWLRTYETCWVSASFFPWVRWRSQELVGVIRYDIMMLIPCACVRTVSKLLRFFAFGLLEEYDRSLA